MTSPAGSVEKVFSFPECTRLITVQAQEITSNLARSVEHCSLLESVGRVLGEDLRADRDFPPFRRSTRDGYACRAEDLRSVPAVLRVVAEVPAGSPVPAKSLASGEAAEIMTGAPLPEGADCVVMVEHTERLGDDVKILRQATPCENFVATGSEGKQGNVVLARGTRITYAAIAMAAAIGSHEIAVVKRPQVAVLATGNELVEVNTQPEAHQIRNSNTYSVAAQVIAAGGVPVLLPIAHDDREQLKASVATGLKQDLLLVTGGVSVGKYDLVEEIFAELNAEIFFTGALIQPGKPTVFARIPNGHGTTYCFGLPGNPISTMVTFAIFVQPILTALAGASPSRLPLAAARLEEEIRVKSGLTRFLPALLGDGFLPSVKAVAWRGSGDIVARSVANCYIVVPPDCTHLQAGDVVTVLLA